MRAILCVMLAAILVTLTPSMSSATVIGSGAVAFTAYVTTGRSIAASYGSVIRFGSVIENTRHAYSSYTGAFTAPFDGVYSFLVSVDVSSDYTRLRLLKNGQDVVWGDNDGSKGNRITTGAVISLGARDVVKVVHGSTSGSVYEGRESVFVGYRVW